MASNNTIDSDLSESQATIPCRSCNNEMPVDANTCPHCGSRVITRLEAGLLAAGGFVVMVGTAYVGIWPIAVLGLLALVVGIGFYRNRKQKIAQAME